MKKHIEYNTPIILLVVALLIQYSFNYKNGEKWTKQTPQNIAMDTIKDKEQTKEIQPQISENTYPKEYSSNNYQKIYRRMWEGVYFYKEVKSDTDNTLVEFRLDFFDTLGQKIKEYDVMGNNPYNKKTVPNLVDENYQASTYRTFIPKSYTQDKSEYQPTVYYTRIEMPASETMPVVGYHLLGGMEEKGASGIVDWRFTAVCFDEKGNIIRKFKDLDIDASTYCVSEDKKFFMVGYGGLRGENLTRLRNNGIRIYEIESGELVYEKEVDRKHDIGGPGLHSVPNFGGFNIAGNDFSQDKSIIMAYIDLRSRKIYTYKIPNRYEEYVNKAYVDKVIMKDIKADSTYTLYFNRDFEVENF